MTYFECIVYFHRHKIIVKRKNYTTWYLFNCCEATVHPFILQYQVQLVLEEAKKLTKISIYRYNNISMYNYIL